jgi:hypothetical protein
MIDRFTDNFNTGASLVCIALLAYTTFGFKYTRNDFKRLIA